MAEFSNYPNQIDTTTELPKATDNVTPVRAELFNRLRDALIAVEQELGIQPSSTYSTVKDRIDALEARINDIGIEGPPGPQGATGAQGPAGSSTGPAGGDLSGNYPNPNVIGLTHATSDLIFNQGSAINIDTSSAQSLSIGATNVNAINIGHTSVIVNTPGGIKVNSTNIVSGTPDPSLVAGGVYQGRLTSKGLQWAETQPQGVRLAARRFRAVGNLDGELQVAVDGDMMFASGNLGESVSLPLISGVSPTFADPAIIIVYNVDVGADLPIETAEVGVTIGGSASPYLLGGHQAIMLIGFNISEVWGVIQISV